jgi:hypothetical protein
MLAVSHRSSSVLPSPHYRAMDESATINPAALNAPSKSATHGQPAVALSPVNPLTVASHS